MPDGLSVRKRDFIRRHPKRHRLVHRVHPEAVVWFFQSGHRLRRCGITFSANRRVEWRTLSFGHVADMHQAEDVADAQGLDQLLHLLAHRLGRARDEVAAVQTGPSRSCWDSRAGRAWVNCDSAPVWMVLMVR
jgi:hypothetical protein